MNDDDKERVELLAALHAAGAASEEDERELQAMLDADPSLVQVVKDFEDSITALATSFDPMETSASSLDKIQKQIAREKGGFWSRVRDWFSK